MTKDHYLDFEEQYHAKGEKKSSRKERKEVQSKDKSKYKISDEKKKQASKPFPTNDETFRRGRVLAISKEGIFIGNQKGEYLCVLKGALKKEKTKQKNLIVVGDFVRFTKTNNATETIVFIEPRKTLLSRADNLSRKKQQLIAANIDQILITSSIYQPYLKPALIDRYIIATKKGGMEPIIIINKIDYLQNPPTDLDQNAIDSQRELFEQFLTDYSKLGLNVLLVSAQTGEGLENLQHLLQSKASAFVGQSGVGKTSLINLAAAKKLKVGELAKKTKKGAHTTTSSVLLPIDQESFIIDTPGIKSFGLWELSKSLIHDNFSEFKPFSIHCRFPNCTHTHEPDCTVKEAVNEKKISAIRYESYKTLLQETAEKGFH
jgi:ribosome biogenesis GTPase